MVPWQARKPARAGPTSRQSPRSRVATGRDRQARVRALASLSRPHHRGLGPGRSCHSWLSRRGPVLPPSVSPAMKANRIRAADGSRSPVRSMLNIGMVGPGPLAHLIGICFRAGPGRSRREPPGSPVLCGTPGRRRSDGRGQTRRPLAMHGSLRTGERRAAGGLHRGPLHSTDCSRCATWSRPGCSPVPTRRRTALRRKA